MTGEGRRAAAAACPAFLMDGGGALAEGGGSAWAGAREPNRPGRPLPPYISIRMGFLKHFRGSVLSGNRGRLKIRPGPGDLSN